VRRVSVRHFRRILTRRWGSVAQSGALRGGAPTDGPDHCPGVSGPGVHTHFVLSLSRLTPNIECRGLSVGEEKRPLENLPLR